MAVIRRTPGAAETPSRKGHAAKLERPTSPPTWLPGPVASGRTVTVARRKFPLCRLMTSRSRSGQNGHAERSGRIM